MKKLLISGKSALSFALALNLLSTIAASGLADESVDVSGKKLSPGDINAGLFPNEECERLKASGFKCLGFKPAVRFSLPAASFKLGSDELPDELKRELDVFAQALKSRPPDSPKVRVEGHADASGDSKINLDLSKRRAERAKEYLVANGVNPELLTVVGVGATEPKVAADPFAPENRRVVIEREKSNDAKSPAVPPVASKSNQ
jgi:outer membrane protein OmpA-like peptidoglycan-associated protein